MLQVCLIHEYQCVEVQPSASSCTAWLLGDLLLRADGPGGARIAGAL